jgi:hypothetical protein
MILEYRLCVVVILFLLEPKPALDRFVRVELSRDIINDPDFNIRGAVILTSIQRGRLVLDSLDSPLLAQRRVRLLLLNDLRSERGQVKLALESHALDRI